MSVSANWSKLWENGKSLPEQYNINLGMAPTSKLQVNMGYNHSETTDTYDLTSNWHINDIFTVYAQAGYIEPSSGDALTYKTMLSVRF